MRTFDGYQDWTMSTAAYPDAGTGFTSAVVYAACSLAGEAGEAAGKASKLMRDGDSFALRNDIRDELGDVLWHLTRLAEELGVDLSTVAARNIDKLELRQASGTIHGSGDHR